MARAMFCALFTAVTLALAIGCAAGNEASTPRAAATQGGLRLPEGARFVDLTYPFDDRTIYWPTAATGFVLNRVRHGLTEGGYFYASNDFCAPEHGGTHFDAPIHFAEGKSTADAVPISRLVAPAAVVDVSAAAAKDADYRVTSADIEAFEREHGAIAPGSVVLIRTGWGSRWPDRKRYLGDDTRGDASNLHFPGIGEDAARALVARKVASVGIDTASIDHGPSKDFIAHRVLLGADVPAFENVASLEALPARGALVVALPMKIRGGSGGPLRIIALLPR
ncbi:cyclase family protein [Sorangium cellulosum]|nr:cyclase family protein [Sorangium cellulosum]